MDNLSSMTSDEVSDCLNLEEDDSCDNSDPQIPDIAEEVLKEQNDYEQDFAHQLSDIGGDCIDCEENDNCLKDDTPQNAMNDEKENSDIGDDGEYINSVDLYSDIVDGGESNNLIRSSFDNESNFDDLCGDIVDGGESKNLISSSYSPTPQVELDNQLLSLKQNCLNHIINNFEIFNNAFVNLSSEETVLCQNLTYLQRAFSSDIINGLSEKKLLKDKYLTFLINEHLKELDVSKFEENNCSLEAIEKRIYVVGYGLTKVLLCSHQVWTNIPGLFCHLSNVEVLRIQFDECHDEVVENIFFYCSKLRELYFEDCYFPGKGLKQLSEVNCRQTECSIKVLSLKDSHITDFSIIIYLLRNMPFLEDLDCENLVYALYSMHKEDLKNNALKDVKKYNLTRFDIDYCVSELSDVLKVWTEVCPNIKRIKINVSISEIPFDLFSGFSNLETLVLSSLSDVLEKRSNNFHTFLKSHGSKLKHLQIPNISISVFDLIKTCPKLESLSLFYVDFQSLESIPLNENMTLKNLNKLILTYLRFSEECIAESVIEILLCSPSLNYVLFNDCRFENCDITTELEKYFKDCSVEFFVFQSCDIRLDMLQSIILNCSSLKSLKIDECKNITSKDVLSLKKLRNVANSLADIVFNIYEEVEYDDFDRIYHRCFPEDFSTFDYTDIE